MKIAVLKETRPHEARVAATPDTVKKYIGLGCEVAVEKGAGAGSEISDAMYKEAGATVAASAAAALKGADIVLKVQRPQTGDKDEVKQLAKGSRLFCIMSAFQDKGAVEALAKQGVTAFAMEFMPRITRAQSMDVLSSQSNLAGYRAVIDAAHEFGRIFPMMMTAAGTVAPARALVLGAGVAGLQAIATAKRLGAVVSAFDVRPAVKEQVESLGASFVEVDPEATADAETAGGYAKEMSEEYQKKQRQVIHDTIKKQDIVVTTAQIPGKPAPILITADMVKDMKPGSVIVDLASETGGNCELTQHGKNVVKHGVKILAYPNVPSRLAQDASALYAKNLLNLLTALIDTEAGALKLDFEDEIVRGTVVAHEGKVVHPALGGKAPEPAPAEESGGDADEPSESEGDA